MGADEPTGRGSWSIDEIEAILDAFRDGLDRGEYGDGADKDRVCWCLDEGRWYIAKSRKVTAQIMALDERADRLFEEFAKLAEELER